MSKLSAMLRHFQLDLQNEGIKKTFQEREVQDIYGVGYADMSKLLEDEEFLAWMRWSYGDTLLTDNQIEISQAYFDAHTYEFDDIDGNTVIGFWGISDEFWTDFESLSLPQITAIMMEKNSGLVDRGFNEMLFEAAQAYGLNPKILLATLQWEQSWCIDPITGRNDVESLYERAFGITGEYNSMTPHQFSSDEAGGVFRAASIYQNWFEDAQQYYDENGNFNYTGHYNYDPEFKDDTSSFIGQIEGLEDYLTNGTYVDQINATMYARYKYNSWLDHPRNGYSTEKFHNTLYTAFEDYHE